MSDFGPGSGGVSSADDEKARELLVLVLNEINLLDDVLSALIEAGINNATVLESQGMGRVLTQDLPIFAGFRHLFAGSKPYNTTILAPCTGVAMRQEVIALLRDVFAQAPQREMIGSMAVLPLMDYLDFSTNNS
jgi:hypothetical protein